MRGIIVVIKEETTLLHSFLGISLELRPMYLSVFAFPCGSSRLFIMFFFVAPWCALVVRRYV